MNVETLSIGWPESMAKLNLKTKIWVNKEDNTIMVNISDNDPDLPYINGRFRHVNGVIHLD